MRRFPLAVLLCIAGLAQADLIDLDRPGAFEALQARHPDRYQRILEIANVAKVEPCETLPNVLLAKYEVDNTRCSPYLLLATYPPKRTVTFTTMGDTYVTNIVLDHLQPAKVQPAGNPLQPLR